MWATIGASVPSVEGFTPGALLPPSSPRLRNRDWIGYPPGFPWMQLRTRTYNPLLPPRVGSACWAVGRGSREVKGRPSCEQGDAHFYCMIALVWRQLARRPGEKPAGILAD